MHSSVRRYLASIGSKGGRASRRTLDPAAARDMVRVREARRTYRRFHTECFWSEDPDYRVTLAEVRWVAKRLMTYGGRLGWEVGARLCR